MTNTYRVVAVYDNGQDRDRFVGASGIYDTMENAKAQLLDIARSWVGLASPELRADGAIVVTHDDLTITYSILTERKSEHV